MGSVVQKYKGEERKIAPPHVYALLENKQEIAYHKVLQVKISSAKRAGIRIHWKINRPQIPQSDLIIFIYVHPCWTWLDTEDNSRKNESFDDK